MAKETAHPGFYIPNAGDVTNPRMAEPDRVDFSTLAHPLWGVVEGCLVWVTSTLAQTSGGICLVNGQLVIMNPGSVNVGSGGTLDRFDLIVCDSGGLIGKVEGTQATDPVFPDPPTGVTVLAAVFAPAGAADLSANTIDKRKFVNKALLTKIGTGEALIRNVNGSGNHFLADGGGKMTWENDAQLYRSAPYEITIRNNLHLSGSLDLDGEITVDGKVASGGTITGDNLISSATPPGTAMPGDILQNTSTGKIYVWQNGWQEMATVRSAQPPGTVITSLEIPEVMVPLGWVPIDGRTIKEDAYPALFQVTGLQSRINNSPTPREMTLPNAQKLMMVTDFQSVSGTKVSPRGLAAANFVTLLANNMPRHGHNPKTVLGGAANPTATTSRQADHIHTVSGGSHAHVIVDKAHRHHGMELNEPGQIGYPGIASPVIALMWGGGNKLDALFNDRNHTYSVEAFEWTMPALTGITATEVNSSHGHTADPAGGHDHTVTVNAIAAHVHDMTEELVGNNTPFDITPEYLSVYSYVRS